MTGRTNQHDGHRGAPVEVPPVYGNDTASEEEENDEEQTSTATKQNGDEVAPAQVKILSWNVNSTARHTSDCEFLRRVISAVDIACLQEVTPGAREWLQRHLSDDHTILTPQTCCGAAWPFEEHDVAVVYRISMFEQCASPKHWELVGSRQQRASFVVTLLYKSSGYRLTFATAHLESGVCGSAGVRSRQLQSV